MKPRDPVEVTLRTENVGHVKDKLALLIAAMTKVLGGSASLEEVIEANFDDDPKVVMIVTDPVMSHLPSGTVRADIRKLS